MTPELKYLDCPDLQEADYWGEEFVDGLYVYAFIGPRGSEACESFLFRVFSSVDFARFIEDLSGSFFCKATLIVKERNVKLISSAIKELCASITGENWEDISRNLSLYGASEYENYKKSGGN